MMAASKVFMLRPENGATLSKTQVVKGVTAEVPITTVEEKAQRRLEKEKKREHEKADTKKYKEAKGEDDREKAELKQLMETIPEEEEVAIDAISLVVKSSRIVDWKIHKEGKKSYYQISMQIYMLVEKTYPLTPPTLSMMLEKKLQIDYESEIAY
uniref:Uncharacterized protein n=1 Tax=Tanacetum cinerariifolium TaxID=118510 RepID=A0A699IM88_TANCI|nr:hypothetical protein [Tanacetum cinerariifolium]